MGGGRFSGPEKWAWATGLGLSFRVKVQGVKEGVRVSVRGLEGLGLRLTLTLTLFAHCPLQRFRPPKSGR